MQSIECVASRSVYRYLFWNSMKNFKVATIIANLYKRKLLYKYSITIGDNCRIGKNLSLPHPQGIVIGNNTVIGDNVVIFQGVTIGRKYQDKDTGYPIIKDGCILYPYSSVVGKIRLGTKTILATHSVLFNSTHAGSTWAGIPAREIREKVCKGD